MRYIDAVNKFFKEDKFAVGIGIKIEQAKKDYALCSLKIEDRHLNAAGRVQGGVSFTLGDFTFAVAANSCGKNTVSLDSTISHTKPAKGKMLYAEATKMTSTRHVAFYQVRVYDELGTDVARMQVTGYITDVDNGLDPEDYDA